MDRPLRAALAASTLAIALTLPDRADASGGTFRDAEVSTSVEQSAETVLLVRDGAHTELHVQIAYTGDPDSFAWIVPVPAAPELAVGSQALFDRMRIATEVRFSTEVRLETCKDDDDDDDAPHEDDEELACGSPISFEGFTGDYAEPEPPEEPEPEPPNGIRVGAYDVELLEAGSVDEVEQWLDLHAFQRDPDAPAVLQQYIDEGFVFVAFTLLDGVAEGEIHPLVIRYEGEPSLPLRLTQIAAIDDMSVRVLALDETRTVPTNYFHVELDPVRIDWLDEGRNYEEVVARAIDETGTGRGFVTEYAGPSNRVPSAGLVDPRWDADAFVGLGAMEALVELTEQGFTLCEAPDCTASHPQLAAMLERWIVVPPGLVREDLLRCPSCYTVRDGFEGWDATGFAADFDSRIVQPGLRAQQLLETRPYLTALHTRISPREMTVDPTFHTNAALDDVAPTHAAEWRHNCKGIDRVTLPDGREVGVESATWPSFDDELFPFAELIAQVPAAGDAIAERDATEAIDEELVAANTELLRRTHANPQQISVAWGGWVPGDDGCGQCTTPGRRRSLNGPLWMLVLLAVALRMRRPATAS